MGRGPQPNIFGTTTYGGDTSEGTVYFYDVPDGYAVRSLQCQTPILYEGCFPYTTPSVGGSANQSVTLLTFYGGGAYNHGAMEYGNTSYSFCLLSGCPDGSGPASALALDSTFNAYGTTRLGGANDLGVVYECVAQPQGYCNPVSVLHSFAGGPNDGAYPFLATPLIVPSCSQFGCGNILWGTTPLGGAFGDNIGGYGTIWDIDNFGFFHLVHSFDWTDGAFPYAGLTNLNGTYYGTTSGGGPFQRQCCPLRFKAGQGTIYSLTSGGTLTTLHTFTGSDGALPYSGLVADSSGNLYGVTFSGGTFNAGVVYEITP